MRHKEHSNKNSIKFFSISRKKVFRIFMLLLIFSSPVFCQTLSLEEALANLGGELEFRWDPFFNSGTFVNGRFEASFFSGAKGEFGSVLLDRRDIVTLPLPYLENGSIHFPQLFINQLLTAYNNSYYSNPGGFRIGAIIIDPGHGGVDPGTVWDYTVNGQNLRIMEKNITLRASMLLQAQLRSTYPDKQIILTRTGDYNLTLEQRTDVANSLNLKDNEIAIFISIHANSSFNRNARGFEVFFLDPTQRRELVDRSLHEGYEEVIDIINELLEQEIATESVMLATYILRRLDEAVGRSSPNRGLKSENWFVVRNALMPAVLIELGFVSNREEALLLNTEAYLIELSNALYKGIVDFITFFERSGGIASIQ